ncbi:4'-phosphopantetheinyl transferase superfamily protein [Streptococcus mutans]|uniref:4'-phosphopantetheinyl transferase family protein n=1 Tax=Streptococcus mutans TaxID=1309 RepID=UPI0002B56265|nr:4'-phosphopantetheinyl transferase superfamily protein [Streptococcus mutans]EMB52090.1 putative phosphopantetheinyl transferase [Streptococcus mutans 1ID3]EMB58292.1 putative phosphopantetheinyl transferase [Streptococcus mutans 15JP3]EMB71788.1 putative phosphopantetheinyl transferase [Streptococcus mutans 4VF1]EMB74849.1 putative phosphopantetheinyl transferase [Streptococcus mutans 15VF2]EMB83330.1 putative phosphopantetheinyl transferase [Streptococcus mutans NVAB]
MKIFKIRSQKPLEDRMFFSLLELIEEEDRKQILRYQFWQDRQRSLLGHLLSRYAIIQEYALTNKEIQIRRHAYGKPYIKDYSQIHYNISHSGEWVVVAIGKSPIGIDVENRREDWDLIGERVFSESEKYWSQNSYKRKAILWTIKEAYVKYLGIGLSKSLNSFSIDIKRKIITEVQKPFQTSFDYFVLDNDYVCSECGYTKGAYYSRKVCQAELDTFITSVLDISY